jgi:hypothetical protein
MSVMQLHRLRPSFAYVPTAYDDYRVEIEDDVETAPTLDRGYASYEVVHARSRFDAPTVIASPTPQFSPLELDFFAAGDDLVA